MRTHKAAVTSNEAVLDGGRPIEERIDRLARAWVEDGRARDHLVTGTAFHAVYCWYLRHRPEGHAPSRAAFVTAS
ncbi:hypothetical protein ACIOD1_10250 [Streptomyces sp. NPDC088097]|uniref:hypothetical protein n=1 Tax=Streptomyces sp. NPDC088097 TaxID=3365823 RepID=UPI0037FB8986